MIFSNVSLTIGKTPLIELSRFSAELGVRLLAKTESRNPAGSVKCRVAYAMIDDAERSGRLSHEMTLLEPTSGNTGIALASLGRARGYNVEIVMPENMSAERKHLIKGLGSGLMLTPASGGMAGAIAKAETLLRENPEKYFMPGQFINPANPAIHALTTGPEIDQDTGGMVDAIVAGVGTGGTISGIGCYFKKMKQTSVKMIAVEPAKSPVISNALQGENPIHTPHGIQGIGAGFIPSTLDLSIIDNVITVEDAEAVDMARRLMCEEGILSGISGGAALCGAVKAVGEIVPADKNITMVVIIPDSGERYLSTELYA
ncbi:MAG: cysteine synthase A [Deferribacteraceae bacterium]|nr:cysteine synthase A [Deferribacteraceae bacterium]